MFVRLSGFLVKENCLFILFMCMCLNEIMCTMHAQVPKEVRACPVPQSWSLLGCESFVVGAGN